jgi:hypothetical protein
VECTRLAFSANPAVSQEGARFLACLSIVPVVQSDAIGFGKLRSLS